MSAKILIVDDEKLIVKGLRVSLENDDYEVDTAYDGQEALEKIQKNHYSLILLDVMLPLMDGTEVCQRVREFSDVPIIMVTAKSDDMDKILGLEYGADDYVTKPFNIMELKARIKAILRRMKKAAPPAEEKTSVLRIGDFCMDLENRNLHIGERRISLTGKEFELLELLASNPGKVYGRAKLLQLIWGQDYPGDERTVDVHVRRLREKIEPNPSEPFYVQTKWGVGYYFRETGRSCAE
jgi:two-component system, OmpR family, response regulator VicR